MCNLFFSLSCFTLPKKLIIIKKWQRECAWLNYYLLLNYLKSLPLIYSWSLIIVIKMVAKVAIKLFNLFRPSKKKLFNLQNYRTNLVLNLNLDLFFHVQTWMYIAFPVLLYAGERIFRAIRSGSYEVDILKVFDQPSLICIISGFKVSFDKFYAVWNF